MVLRAQRAVRPPAARSGRDGKFEASGIPPKRLIGAATIMAVILTIMAVIIEQASRLGRA
jgi:hypothetical protein